VLRLDDGEWSGPSVSPDGLRVAAIRTRDGADAPLREAVVVDLATRSERVVHSEPRATDVIWDGDLHVVVISPAGATHPGTWRYDVTTGLDSRADPFDCCSEIDEDALDAACLRISETMEGWSPGDVDSLRASADVAPLGERGLVFRGLEPAPGSVVWLDTARRRAQDLGTLDGGSLLGAFVAGSRLLVDTLDAAAAQSLWLCEDGCVRVADLEPIGPPFALNAGGDFTLVEFLDLDGSGAQLVALSGTTTERWILPPGAAWLSSDDAGGVIAVERREGARRIVEVFRIREGSR
jgi:hypothetical protein